jgi:NADPH:quinone reductase-like Zn-dependent oxidoreductase
VLATGSTGEKRSRALDLGAEHAIDPSDPQWARQVKELTAGEGADVVFENVGEATFQNSLLALAKGGRLVTCGATTGSQVTVELKRLFFKNQQIIGSTMGRREDLTRLLSLQQQGKIHAVIDSEYPLQELHGKIEPG